MLNRLYGDVIISCPFHCTVCKEEISNVMYGNCCDCDHNLCKKCRYKCSCCDFCRCKECMDYIETEKVTCYICKCKICDRNSDVCYLCGETYCGQCISCKKCGTSKICANCTDCTMKCHDCAGDIIHYTYNRGYGHKNFLLLSDHNKCKFSLSTILCNICNKYTCGDCLKYQEIIYENLYVKQCLFACVLCSKDKHLMLKMQYLLVSDVYDMKNIFNKQHKIANIVCVIKTLLLIANSKYKYVNKYCFLYMIYPLCDL